MPILVIGVVGLGIIFIPRLFLSDDFNLPQGEAVRETIMVKDTGTKKEVEREILVTDGVRHSVPLDEVVGGGPPKDGIPPIDNPEFIISSEVDDWLQDDEPGLSISQGATNRFYPYQILVWHEIVNDTIDGKRILVTYCPLCFSGIVFDPVVQGERVEFGTSGKLWQSNLVMYDRKTDSLWSQILGEAIVGEMTGTTLRILSSDQMLYGEWKKNNPTGQVLARPQGAGKFYGVNPYGSYYSVANFSLNLVNKIDDRLSNDTFVFGLIFDSVAKAYNIESVKQKGVVKDKVGETDVVLRYDKELDVVRVFQGEKRINPISGFWFSWVAAHPDTEVYK
ncbi:MAG: DUF3179 domain-containing protein [Patescibacteria group bacterium]|nr:DUF3179 domain-containing protein [Patescibacteria group bacterium]